MSTKLLGKFFLFYFVVLFLILCELGCGSSVKVEKEVGKADSIKYPEYAHGFSIEYYDGFKVLNIISPFDSLSVDKVYIIKKGSTDLNLPDDAVVVEVPVKNVGCLSSTHISFIDTLGEINSIRGVSDLKYIFNNQIGKKAGNGEVEEIAVGNNIGFEKIIAIDPDVLFISPFKELSFAKLIESGVKVIPVSDYLEFHPLGRLEWIKVMGLFYDKQELAESIYDSSKNMYLSSAKLAGNAVSKPMVFDAFDTWGTWYASGGNSYMAIIYKDAGGDYIYSGNNEYGSFPVNFEEVYAKSYDADFWRVAVDRPAKFSLNQFKSENQRYKDFRSVNNGNVIFCNVNEVPLFERGVIEPDKILNDFIKVFHPELLPDYSPHYYSLLK